MKRLSIIEILKYVAFCVILLLFVIFIPKYVVIPVTTFIITAALRLSTPWNIVVLITICAIGGLVLFGLPTKKKKQDRVNNKRIGKAATLIIVVASLFASTIGLTFGVVTAAYAYEKQEQQIVETNEVTDVILTQQANDVEEKTPPIVIIFCTIYVVAVVLCIIGLFVVKRRENNTAEQHEKQLESEETVNDK